MHAVKLMPVLQKAFRNNRKIVTLPQFQRAFLPRKNYHIPRKQWYCFIYGWCSVDKMDLIQLKMLYLWPLNNGKKICRKEWKLILCEWSMETIDLKRIKMLYLWPIKNGQNGSWTMNRKDPERMKTNCQWSMDRMDLKWIECSICV